ncbi:MULTISPECIES: aegerolysin family protein [Pseudomonas]|uniref:Aegerolysin n=1 Tax=Pseudomonas lini TaxID=163011 RepID=A0A0J6H8N3_9PSED|nr:MULTISPECIES: aegerolysin family protein [Pseudomonas]KAB0498163.1 Crystal protein ET79 [Pseudomonas lini]KMM93371.1 hypothetical protein TU81_11225 [Pseudomonas lini]MDT9678252.1 Crystal protein ET79 [Pseudomonas sp. JV414]SDT53278.1 Aegerolysin [Pseudomonas lini]
MAKRSVDVYFENYLDSTLSLTQNSLKLDHGEWDTYPPQKILKPSSNVSGKGYWKTESDGFATGTEALCSYAFYDFVTEEICNINIHWDDPYVGSNSYEITTDSDNVKVSYSGGDGDNATVTFRAEKR